MIIDVEPTVYTGRIHAARSGPEGTPCVFSHVSDHDSGRYEVRWLTEDELATLAAELCDMLAAGPPQAAPALTSSARIRDRDLPALRRDRDGAP